MIDIDQKLDSLKTASRPCLFMYAWPETVGVNAESIRAAMFSAMTAEAHGADMLLLREDDRVLAFSRLGNTWRVTSGEFSGAGSRTDSCIVKIDSAGQPIAPKKGIMRLLPGNNGAKCTWQEAIAIALHFVQLGDMPSECVWWSEERTIS